MGGAACQAISVDPQKVQVERVGIGALLVVNGVLAT